MRAAVLKTLQKAGEKPVLVGRVIKGNGEVHLREA